MKKYELVVCGGGLAGVCSAIAGKRLGLSTCIIQDRPVFGGNASSEIRVNIGGACAFNTWARETGIISEIFLEERRRNFEYHRTTWNNGILDIVLYEFLRNEGVDIYLNTSVRKAIMKSKDLIEGVYCVQVGSEKEFIIYGDYFVDATGDGVVGFSSGAEFRIGRESKYEFNEDLAPEKQDMGIMGNSLLFLIRDVGRPVEYNPPDWAIKYDKDDICLKLRHHEGLPGYWWIEIGYPFDTIYDNEDIKHNLLAYVFGIWDHLKNTEDHKEKFKNFVLEWVSMVPGKRESRRFVGDYILNENDIKKRRKFEDAVAYGGWFIDLHTPGGILAKDQPPEPSHVFDVEKHNEEVDKRFAYVYQIPYRCIYSKDIKNLFFAGRNISVSHVALGTTRIMGTCSLLGQVAGTSVYLCKKYNCTTREIYENGYYKELQQILLRESCFIPDIKNEDENDLCLKAKITASSSSSLKFENINGEIKLDMPFGEKLPLIGKIKKIKLKGKVKKDTILKFHLRSSCDLWDFNSEKDIFYKEIEVKKGQEEIVVDIDKEFEKGIYWFYFEKNEDAVLNATDEIFPGTCLIFKPRNLWRFRTWTKNLYFETEPEIYPFEPENIITGVSRPEKWTNVWISDKGMPQYIEIDLKEEKEFNFIQFVFDADIDKRYIHIPPFYVPPTIPNNFKIYSEIQGKWEEIMNVENNTKYFCKYKLENKKSKKIKVEFLSTNGSEKVYVYEIRIYKI